MNVSRAQRILSGSVVPITLAVACSCSWSRFDDLQDNPPVVTMKGSVAGFGTSIASWTAPEGSDGRLLVLGSSQGAGANGSIFSVSGGEISSQVDSSLCSGECVQGDTPTALASWIQDGTSHEGCFVYAVGTQGGKTGLVGKCADGTFLTLAVPEPTSAPGAPSVTDDIRAALRQVQLNGVSDLWFSFGASRDAKPLLVASVGGGASSVPKLWFYAHSTSSAGTNGTPAAVLVGGEAGQMPKLGSVTAGAGFGGSVAVARTGDTSYLIAVGDGASGEGAAGRVWLYRVSDGVSVDKDVQGNSVPAGVLCGHSARFGWSVHAGNLGNSAETEQLLVSDGTNLFVYDAGQLYRHPAPSGGCATSLQEGRVLLAAVRCEQTSSLDGCDHISTFGQNVVVADLNGDGRSELVVGVPELRVSGREGAGAALVYSLDLGKGTVRMREARFLSSTDGGDSLGRSLGAAWDGKRDVLVAGIPGRSEMALFYCSTMGGQGAASPRCR